MPAVGNDELFISGPSIVEIFQNNRPRSRRLRFPLMRSNGCFHSPRWRRMLSMRKVTYSCLGEQKIQSSKTQDSKSISLVGHARIPGVCCRGGAKREETQIGFNSELCSSREEVGVKVDESRHHQTETESRLSISYWCAGCPDSVPGIRAQTTSIDCRSADPIS